MLPEDVLSFLDQHPDFLEQNAGRFGLKPSHDRIVSFAERQMLDLRDQNRQLEVRLQQMLQFGELNDKIVTRCHALSLGLLKSGSVEEAVLATHDLLKAQFGLDRSAIRLWHPSRKDSADYCSRKEIQQLAQNQAQPYCGPYINDEMLAWLPGQPVLQSFASVALRVDGAAFGVLLIGSDDAERFTRDMQTQYLAQIGELISARIGALLAQA